MTSKREPRLPADHAFVVQVCAQVSGESGQVEGRVEHLVSGAARRFGSWEELHRFIEETIGQLPRGAR